jgi:hypothetical protein
VKDWLEWHRKWCVCIFSFQPHCQTQHTSQSQQQNGLALLLLLLVIVVSECWRTKIHKQTNLTGG